MRISRGVWIHAERIASFCFMPWEYAAIGFARSAVSANISAYFAIRASRSAFDTPKMSAMKFRYFSPVIKS